MRRFLRSLIPGLVIGTLIGLYLGWVEFPQEAYRSDMSEMAPSFRDDYLIMIAAGYAVDGDIQGAVERLHPLGVADVAGYVQHQTERIIDTAARNIRDTRLLVGLARGLGRLTPVMEPFLDLAGGTS